LRELEAYLERAGVPSCSANTLEPAALAAGRVTVVLFPDDFPPRLARPIRTLRSRRPDVLLLVVTSAPQSLREVLRPDGVSVPPAVLPKPAFGWAILDAIRAHAAGDAPS
jgi:hypothetical protein